MKELQVVLNGKEESLEKSLSLLEFLASKGLSLETIIVEYNGDIIKKQEWPSIALQNKDRLEVLNFVGGG